MDRVELTEPQRELAVEMARAGNRYKLAILEAEVAERKLLMARRKFWASFDDGEPTTYTRRGSFDTQTNIVTWYRHGEILSDRIDDTEEEV